MTEVPDDPSPTIVVRHAVSADFPAMVRLLCEYGQVDTATAAGDRLARIAGRQDHYLPVAEVGEELVGYAWVQDYGPHLRAGHRTARMHDLFVTVAWRRCGVGRQLLAAVKAWASNRDVRWLQWQAGEDAVPFYLAQGYEGDACPDPGHPFYEIDFS